MFSVLYLLPLSVLTGVCGAVDHLLPVKRSLPTLSGRSIDYASHLRLQTQTELLYSHPWDEEQRVVTSVKFNSKPDKGILALEDIDHLTQSVSCNSSAIVIKFINPHSLKAAEAEWDDGFILITSHDGCGSDHQRTPYHIPNVNFDHECMAATLEAEELPWTQVGHSMEVHYGHVAVDKYSNDANLRVRKRDIKGSHFNVTFVEDPKNETLKFAKDYGARTQLYPPTAEIPETNTSASASIPQLSNFQLTCLDCLFNASISVGGRFGVVFNNSFQGLAKQIEEDFSDDFSTGGSFWDRVKGTAKDITESIEELGDNVVDDLKHLIRFENASASATIDKFDARLGMEIVLEKGFSLNKSWDLAPKIPLSPFIIPGIVVVGPVAGVALGMTASFTGSLNFSSGIEFQVPTNATAKVDLLDISSSSFTGWSDTSVSHRPFTLHAGQPSVTFSAALKPYVELTLTIGPNSLGVSAGLELNLPKLSVTLSPLPNVTVNCTEPKDTDFELYDSITIDGTSDISLNVQSNIEVFSSRQSIPKGALQPPPIFNFTKPLFETKCLAADDHGILTDLLSIKPSINLAGLTQYFESHDKTLPPGLNATTIVVNDQEGYVGLPKDMQTALKQQSDKEQGKNSTGSAKKSTAAGTSAPLCNVVAAMAAIGGIMMLM